MTPTADDLKAELLAHACKLPASRPPLRTGRPERAASAGVEVPVTFMDVAAGTQPAEQPLMAFPACSSCPPEFWGRPLGRLVWVLLPSTKQDTALHPSTGFTMHVRGLPVGCAPSCKNGAQLSCHYSTNIDL